MKSNDRHITNAAHAVQGKVRRYFFEKSNQKTFAPLRRQNFTAEAQKAVGIFPTAPQHLLPTNFFAAARAGLLLSKKEALAWLH
jgi:hypothetical protein